MGTWNSRGLRGSFLEEMINLTNQTYFEKNLAVIQKIPTPITPIKISKETHQITLAYFEKKSTVDYLGVVQGIPICFDAKECKKDTFPLMNVHEHQMKFMERFEQQQGISFFILYFSHIDKIYYVPYEQMKKFYDRSIEGGRKSFLREELKEAYEIKKNVGVPIHYLEALQLDLNNRQI